MSNANDSLGNRMKTYEYVPRIKLIRRMPVILRLDGKSFHTFTKGFQTPFDPVLSQTMQDTMLYLCQHIQGCVLGYTQSDEISLVLVDYQKLTTDAWYENNVQKLCSVSASMATYAFNSKFESNLINWSDYCYKHPVDVTKEDSMPLCHTYDGKIIHWRDVERHIDAYTRSCHHGALFDARAFNLPKEEVMNYFTWRQQDAARNSIEMVGQANYSHTQLMHKSCQQIQDMLFTEKGINWNDYPTKFKRGSCCIQRQMGISTDHGVVLRNKWTIDDQIPIFNRQPDYINSLIFI